ncbi:hypothetical protein O181_068845 [Austropuccinia psidii MF-1]|uniref:Uncharacterized protein n=1 Tax=Austropuccinia psidii MF-1 TaxID=1389203 RepID=A0A9Q3F1S9_9BASI|nr:hypothetical protein [Austropuccinia psidii MF-1]
MPTLMHELASTSLTNPLQPLMCLNSRTALKICLHSHAPISDLTHPHSSAPLPLKMLTLPLCPQYMPPTLPSPLLKPPPLCPSPSLCSHSSLPICIRFHPHTGLILNAAYHPYNPAAPSRCDSNATLTTPYASAPLPLPRHPQDMPAMAAPHLCTHPCLIFSTTYPPYSPLLDP